MIDFLWFVDLITTLLLLVWIWLFNYEWKSIFEFLIDFSFIFSLSLAQHTKSVIAKTCLIDSHGEKSSHEWWVSISAQHRKILILSPLLSPLSLSAVFNNSTMKKRVLLTTRNFIMLQIRKSAQIKFRLSSQRLTPSPSHLINVGFLNEGKSLRL